MHICFTYNEKIMTKEQTIVSLLVELDKILKLEKITNKRETYTYEELIEEALSKKYANRIYEARSLLGLSLEPKPGALLPDEPVDEFTDLVNKSQPYENNDY